MYLKSYLWAGLHVGFSGDIGCLLDREQPQHAPREQRDEVNHAEVRAQPPAIRRGQKKTGYPPAARTH